MYTPPAFREDESEGGFARMHPLWVRFGNVSVQRPMLGALVIFSDPYAYVTPSWCLSNQEPGKVVPIWNVAQSSLLS